MNSKLLNDTAVAEIVGMSNSWVRVQRHKRRKGLPHTLKIDPAMIGTSPRYRIEDVEAFIEGLVPAKIFGASPMDNQSSDDQKEEGTLPSDTTATVQQSGREESKQGNLSDAARKIASESNILARLSEVLKDCGVVGEEKVAKLCYLALTSRVCERPVSLAVKGPSSSGKSYVTSQVLRFLPNSAYHALTAMSDKALVFSDEELVHRFLVLIEAEGLKSDMASYLVRSLLSEGRISYETVISTTTEGPRSLLIEKEGPTGLLVTTTAANLHPENETRLLSVTVQDTKEQTKAILRSMATDETSEVDLSDWIGFQEWLGTAEHRVVILFAKAIADLSNPAGVRFRRDFGSLLTLIKTHAILHQLNRQRDEDGQIIANLDDYLMVHALVADIISEGLGKAVSKTVRETVNAVKEIISCGNTTQQHSPESMNLVSARVIEVAGKLGIDKSSASRRVKQAIKLGYLVNEEWNKGNPMRLGIRDPLPEEVQVLPTVEGLAAKVTSVAN